MANPAKGEVTLRLSDGREFVLCMDFDMRVQVEELWDKPFQEVAQRAASGFHGAVRALLWGALRRHHPDMTMGEVTELIEQHGDKLEDAMSRAGEAAAPKEGKKGSNPRQSARRAGTNSGRSGAR